MAEQLRVMISSTARDLPEHRKQIVEACLRQGMFPLRMEDLPANGDEAAKASLKMVEDADVYVGVFANHYGYIPKTNNPEQISVTEMEYNRAVERKIERLIFVMDKTHPITVADVDIENASKLRQFKERVLTENIVRFFKSLDDLRAEAIHSLSKIHEPDLTKVRHVSDTPSLPEVFIAHPYTLLQTHTLIGRQKELELLTDWITGKQLEFDGQTAPGDSVRIMSVVAIGGMGKSALTWKWFNDIAPQEMKNLAGRMWWSFYEDSSWDNFVGRSLAFTTRRAFEEIQTIPKSEREDQLLSALEHQKFLIALDGLERVLIGYLDKNAQEDEVLDNVDEQGARKPVDSQIGRFLRKMAQVHTSRVLVNSRWFPADLERPGGEPSPGVFRLNVEGMTEEDAVELWRAFGVVGVRDELLTLFNTFGRYPLLIQTLAGAVKSDRKSPGDFEKWRTVHPTFDWTKSKLKEKVTRVLELALLGLNDDSAKVLDAIAAFSTPVPYDILARMLLRRKPALGQPITEHPVGTLKVFDEETLDSSLRELENRELLGWNRQANQYDLHPIIRQCVWVSFRNEKRIPNTKDTMAAEVVADFENRPARANRRKSTFVAAFTRAIYYFDAMIELERYDDAATLYFERMDIRKQFGFSRLEIALLEQLVPGGSTSRSPLTNSDYQIAALNGLALAYQLNGRTNDAIQRFRSGIEICLDVKHETGLCRTLGNLSNALLPSGHVYESELAARKSILSTRQLVNVTHNDLNAEVITGTVAMSPEALKHYLEGVGLTRLGMALACRGVPRESAECLLRALRIDQLADRKDEQAEGVDNYYLAERALWFADFESAAQFARRACELAGELEYESKNERDLICGRAVAGEPKYESKNERDSVRSRRVRGSAAFGLQKFTMAQRDLHSALTRAHTYNLIEQKLPAFVDLARLHHLQGDLERSRGLLNDVWETAERGPYTLVHADALNVLAQIERDEGNNAAAIEAATKAYRLAWCDGPPYAYHWGLEKAKQHLKELGAPEPEMQPFDESKFEPMPEVEINPKDEFYVDEESVK